VKKFAHIALAPVLAVLLLTLFGAARLRIRTTAARRQRRINRKRLLARGNLTMQ
jgi:hypothetical protein